jgi:cytochrome b subunit of formate dehydrogenase
MITGFVDRQWAKHHYRRWYREHHEATEEALAVEEAPETEVVEETTLVS